MVPSADYPAALQALPLRTPGEAFGRDTLLVIAPHPDDESLGCGGVLAWAARTGRRAEVLFLTDGEGSHPGSAAFPPRQLAKVRAGEAMSAAALLGIPSGNIDFLHLPDGSLAGMPEETSERVREGLRVVMEKLAPCVVFVTASTDAHGDHQRACELAVAASEGIGNCRLLRYPVWSWMPPAGTELPEPSGFRIDILDVHEVKSKAVAAHASQLGRVVTDATRAFVIPEELLERALQRFEVFLVA